MLVPAALVLLSAVPSLVGVVRLVGIVLERSTLPDHERLSAHPIPLVTHIVSATSFAMLGALQFAPSLRRRRFHRDLGRVLAPLGIATAVSGMWIGVAFPSGEADLPLLRALRFAAGSAMIAFVAAGLVVLRRRDFVAHGAWMTRAYAIAVAAGTQFFTVLP